MAELNKKRPKNKSKKANRYRNAGAAPSPARTRTTAPMPDTSRDTPAWRTLKAVGGSVLAAGGCALVARENLLPPKFLTLGVAGIGATLALAAHSSTARDMGLGAASASLAQLGLMVIDDHYQSQRKRAEAKAAPPQAPQVGNLDGLPPGALEAAYERARAQLAASSTN